MIIEFRTVTEKSLTRRFLSWGKRTQVGFSLEHTCVITGVYLLPFGSNKHIDMKSSNLYIDEVSAISVYHTRMVSGEVGTTVLEKYCRASPHDDFLLIRIQVREEGVLIPLFLTHDFFRALWLCREDIDIYVKPGGISEVALHAPGNVQESFEPIYFYHPRLGELRPETESRWLGEAVLDTMRYITSTRFYVKRPHNHSSDLRNVQAVWNDQTPLGALLNHLVPDF